MRSLAMQLSGGGNGDGTGVPIDYAIQLDFNGLCAIDVRRGDCAGEIIARMCRFTGDVVYGAIRFAHQHPTPHRLDSQLL
jgi:hypothetical protein